jgi:exonuclease VII large subunit
MAMKKKTKTIRRTVTRLKRAATPGAAQNPLRKTWNETVQALKTAEARTQKEVRGLLQRNKISTKDAATMLKDVRALVARGRKKGVKQMETRFARVQARVSQERRNVAKRVDNAVQSALAAFNVPSRQEIHELTRKVNELSKKIDSFKR